MADKIIPFKQPSELERLLKASVERAVALHRQVRANRDEGTTCIIAYDTPIAALSHALAMSGCELVVNAKGTMVIRARRDGVYQDF